MIGVPATHPQLAFVLSAMAGHLFGYEAALAIDGQALPLREARAAIEEAPRARFDRGDGVLARPAPRSSRHATRFFDGLRAGEYDGHLEASTAVRLAVAVPLRLGIARSTPTRPSTARSARRSVVVDDLTAGAHPGHRGAHPTHRRHQAPGQDGDGGHLPVRRDAAPGAARAEALEAGRRATASPTARCGRSPTSTRRSPRWWASSATGSRAGWPDGDAPAVVVDRGGIAATPVAPSATGVLRGTKHKVAIERRGVRGAEDETTGAPIVIVPEAKDDQPTGMTLLPCGSTTVSRSAPPEGASQGYRGRYAALRDAVTETEPTFREDLLADIPVIDLLTVPVSDLAERWRSPAGA